MITAIIFMLTAVALLVALVWLLRRPSSWGGAYADQALEIENLFPLHCRHFPQVRQTLLEADTQFMRRRAPREMLRRWRAERREVLRQFLAGLGQDFERLDRLARAVAALSPEVSREREMERLWLSLRFLVMYRLVSLRLATGFAPLPQVARLTELVGTFASQMEARMAALERRTPSRV